MIRRGPLSIIMEMVFLDRPWRGGLTIQQSSPPGSEERKSSTEPVTTRTQTPRSLADTLAADAAAGGEFHSRHRMRRSQADRRDANARIQIQNRLLGPPSFDGCDDISPEKLSLSRMILDERLMRKMPGLIQGGERELSRPLIKVKTGKTKGESAKTRKTGSKAR